MTKGELDRSLATILGGKTTGALRKAFGMSTTGDLLRHYPRRYIQRGEVTDLTALVEGEIVTVMAAIASVTIRKMRDRRGSILEAVLEAEGVGGAGSLTITFFNQKHLEHRIKAGNAGMFSGRVTSFGKRRQLTNPQFVLFPDGVNDDPESASAFASALIPVYPATSSIASWRIAKAVGVVLDGLGGVRDPIPEEILASERLVALAEALEMIHRPSDLAQAKMARDRLRYEEAFVLQVVLAQRRHRASHLRATPRVVIDGALGRAFEDRLPFTLTAGQREIGEQIRSDLAGSHPMHRLLQGDVGSGKTIVALRAMLSVVDAGGQAALLAPTEVLAAQHYRSIKALLGPLAERGQLGGAHEATTVSLLTGSQRISERRRELIEVFTGDAGIVVGTHALIQHTVEFSDLGLVVVDEQHRFGVEQRAALAAKARDDTRPHVLIMTATPIPRTVAMTVFGDLDVSTLTELPAGRTPISTHVIPAREQPHLFKRVWERVREEVAMGNRVFVVCPRIHMPETGCRPVPGMEEGPDDPYPRTGVNDATTPPLAAVVEVADRLAKEMPQVRVGTLTGRMTGEAKDSVMARFSDVTRPDGFDVLVSTTVIEVGVDVPVASTMVVLDADFFGMSQLHQLRGRVGRGLIPGLCLLVTDAPAESAGRKRLDAVASTTDGFVISQLDLDMRREGDVLGSVQSGHLSSLRLLEVVRDSGIIERARVHARKVVEDDPELDDQPALRQVITDLTAGEQTDFIEKA